MDVQGIDFTNTNFVIKHIIDGRYTKTSYAKGVGLVKDFFNIREIPYDQDTMAAFEETPDMPCVFRITDELSFIIMPSYRNTSGN